MNRILFNKNEVQYADCVQLEDHRARHIIKVLHGAVGQIIKVGLLNGPRGFGVLKSVQDGRVTLECTWDTIIPPRPKVDLLLAMPRPKVMKRLWAQIAALGVDRIFITNGEKVEKGYFDTHVLHPDVIETLLIEGLQQCGDTQVPKVRICRRLKPFVEDELSALLVEAAHRLIAQPGAEHGAEKLLDAAASPHRLMLAVGPEGGWSAFELNLFQEQGFAPFSFGNRILRTDTACVVLLGMAGIKQPAST